MSKRKEQELKRESESLIFENQKIVDVDMEREVKKSFIEYSMSVIISRALPDVRDGMKPGQRRVPTASLTTASKVPLLIMKM